MPRRAKTSAPPVAEDPSLLSGLKAGDPKAFERLVREKTPHLLAVARRILQSEEDAQDAVQDAFLSAFRSIGSFEGGSKVSTWLHRIAVNASLMKLRTRRRRPERSIEEFLPSFLEDGHQARPTSSWNEAPVRGIESGETRQLVLSGIERLPDLYRVVLILRDIEELDTAETARLLGISEATVKTRLHRARQALRTELDPYFRNPNSDVP